MGLCLPDVLERNLELLKCVHDLLHLSPVIITPSTLMVSKGEVLLHCRQANGTDLVVFRDLGLRRAGIEGQVDATTKSAPSEVFGTSDNFLAVCISQENTMGIRDIVLRAIDLMSRDWGSGTMV